MQTNEDYVRRAKAALGNPKMSDRELGEHLGGYTSGAVSTARYGNMSDPMALKVANVIGVEPGEVLMVARLAREKDSTVRKAMADWLGKVMASTSKVAALVALAVGAVCSTPDVSAQPAFERLANPSFSAMHLDATST